MVIIDGALSSSVHTRIVHAARFPIARYPTLTYHHVTVDLQCLWCIGWCYIAIPDKHVPTKLSSSGKNVPWWTPTIRRMCRKKQRLYNRAKKAKKNKDRYWGQYRAHQTSTSKALRKAKWDYINGILQESLKEGNSKPFWWYIYIQPEEWLQRCCSPQRRWIFIHRQPKESWNPEHPVCICIHPWHTRLRHTPSRPQLSSYPRPADQHQRGREATRRH